MTASAKIWVDADAAPRTMKELLFRASERRGVPVILVANSWLSVPKQGAVAFIQVGKGFDEADHYIAEHVADGDLVITADVPLAARVVEQGALVIQPHGRELDRDSIDQALALRDIKHSLREGGEMTGGPSGYGAKEKQRFAGALDRWITRRR